VFPGSFINFLNFAGLNVYALVIGITCHMAYRAPHRHFRASSHMWHHQLFAWLRTAILEANDSNYISMNSLLYFEFTILPHWTSQKCWKMAVEP